MLTTGAPPSGEGLAIVHDYLTQYGGAEKVLEALHELWPAAPIFTTFYNAPLMRSLGFRVAPAAVHPLLPDRILWRGGSTKLWTPLLPELFRRLNLQRYHTVISSTSFAAHHVRVATGAAHIAYVHSPPRFLYGLSTELDHARLRARVPGIGVLYAHMRRRDQEAGRRVTAFVANSGVVRQRIARAYGRAATVIYPPVDTAAFALDAPVPRPEYFLTWSRLVASKRIDIIVDAATSGGFPLVVAGSGPDEARLRARAGTNVRFMGRVDLATLRTLLAGARAVVFAAEEDFGIVPLEAMAAGKPVIAYGAGGARETIVPGVTGELFPEQTAGALLQAFASFDPARYDRDACTRRARRFARGIFRRRMRKFVRSLTLDGVATSARIE